MALADGLDDPRRVGGLADVAGDVRAALPICAAASSRTSSRRPAMTTCAPAAASSIAACLPRFVPPPVTRTTRPASASGAKICEASAKRGTVAGIEPGVAGLETAVFPIHQSPSGGNPSVPGALHRPSRVGTDMFVGHPADAYSYAYLLGTYLGDGHVADTRRSFQLRITLDGLYPGIIAECAGAMHLSLPSVHPRIRCDRSERRMNVDSGSKHSPDLFPQMGPGRKHERPIVLAPWQREIVEAHPWPFVRGLIHSDGCRTVNRFKTRLPSGRVAEYAYPRYFFSNLSAIRALFCESCERLGLRWTQSNHRNISICASHERRAARRERGAEVLSATRRAGSASRPRCSGSLRGGRAASRAPHWQQVRPAQAVQLARHRLAGLLHDLDAARAAHEVVPDEGAAQSTAGPDEHVGALAAELAGFVGQAPSGRGAHEPCEAIGGRTAGYGRHR